MPAIHRHWTTDEVRPLLENSRRWPRFELINGELIVTPSPGFPHQIAINELLFVLNTYLRQEQVGFALLSPTDLELKPQTITQPDVFVVPKSPDANDERPLPTWKDVKRLLLVIEIVSPSSIRIDRIVKRDFYLDMGVPEYWVVDLDARMVERWTPPSEKPEVLLESIEWRPAGAGTPLRIDLPALFETVRATHRQMEAS